MLDLQRPGQSKGFVDFFGQTNLRVDGAGGPERMQSDGGLVDCSWVSGRAA